MTAEDLLAYRNEPYRQELIEGILHEMEPTGFEHGIISSRTDRLLAAHVEAHDLGVTLAGDVGFKLASDPDTVRAPDVAFVARDRVDTMGIPTGYWPGPPDLAIEVVSPNDGRSDVHAKALHWLAAGARAVVVLDPPNRTATVCRTRHDIQILTGDEPLDLDDVVAGFAPPVAQLFA